jgi:hypothetical protein
MNSTLDKIFNKLSAKSITDIKELITRNKINERGGRTAYRIFINYNEEF